MSTGNEAAVVMKPDIMLATKCLELHTKIKRNIFLVYSYENPFLNFNLHFYSLFHFECAHQILFRLCIRSQLRHVDDLWT